MLPQPSGLLESRTDGSSVTARRDDDEDAMLLDAVPSGRLIRRRTHVCRNRATRNALVNTEEYIYGKTTYPPFSTCCHTR